MKKVYFLFLLLCLNITLYSQTKYNLTNGVQIYNENCNLSRLIFVLPIPVDDNYQTIENLSISEGEIKEIPESDDLYLRYSKINNFPAIGERYKFGYNFYITLYPFTIDVSKIETLYPYDTNSILY